MDTHALKRLLREAYRRLKFNGGWRAVGREFGITGGMAYRIVNSDYIPKTARIRVILHLPALIPTPACPTCGGVHTRKKCTVKPTLPEWVTRGADFLQERERAQRKPLPRVWGRGGKKTK